MKSYRDFIFHSGVKGMKWGVRNEETLRKYGLLSKNGPNPIAKAVKDAVSGTGAAAAASGGSSEDDEEEWVEVIDPTTGKVTKYPKWMVKVEKSLSSDKKIAVYDKKTGKIINSNEVEVFLFPPDKDRFIVGKTENPDDIGVYRRKQNIDRNSSYKEMVDTYQETVDDWNNPINKAKRFLDDLF